MTVPVCHFFTATVGDLFGDADDISSDEEAKTRKSDAVDDEGGGSDRERQVIYHCLLILYTLTCFTWSKFILLDIFAERNISVKL